jgi:hypothetical protein
MVEPSKREEKTFDFCAKTYIAAQAPGRKSGKHAKQWASSLERYAYPVIGNLHASVIDNDHLLQILRPMWSTKTETATRLRGRIECILDWAAHRGYRARRNPAQWEGNLKHELPSRPGSRSARSSTSSGMGNPDRRAQSGDSRRATQ